MTDKIEEVLKELAAARENLRQLKRDLLEKADRAVIAAYNQAIEDAAKVAYVTCAETRHVTLGDKSAAAIRALAKEDSNVSG